jgi:hypothetical protein
MVSIKDVNSAIIAGNFTNEQISSIIDAIKFARSQLTQQNKRAMRLGTTVRFTSSKTGQTLSGTVDKIAIKYITVRTPQGLWRVPANMLTVD